MTHRVLIMRRAFPEQTKSAREIGQTLPGSSDLPNKAVQEGLEGFLLPESGSQQHVRRQQELVP